MRGNLSYAGPDDAFTASASISVPVVKDVLAIRVGAAHRQQDGFIRNTLLDEDAAPFKSNSISSTIRFTPATDVALTVSGYYDWVNGANIPYAHVSGPTDYDRTLELNALNRIDYRYRGVNARLELPIDALSSKLTLVGAYDARDGDSPDSDGDFGADAYVRSRGADRLRTKTAELRLDSDIASTFSSLFGLFYSREETSALDISTIKPGFSHLPFDVVRTTTAQTKADTYAAFGTLFWKPTTAWEVALGLRYDHEDRRATGSVVTVLGPLGASGGPTDPNQLTSNQVEPRLSITRHWDRDLMTYASVARGYRGGGFNAPTAPVRVYKGDSAWTYEIGTKYAAPNRSFSLSGDAFYSDYNNYIGLNSIAPATGGGLVTVDLNSGDVTSYGAEIEGTLRPAQIWSISGGLTYMHARITDASAYTAVTGRTLSSDRLTFQPDWTGNITSDYTIPVGNDSLILTGGLTYKGKRLAATLNQTTPTFLTGYALVNISATYRSGPVEVQAFANNLLQSDYFDAYIEGTTLALAGLAPSDLGIVGDRRRVGVRVGFHF